MGHSTGTGQNSESMKVKYLIMDYDGTLSEGNGIDGELFGLMKRVRLSGTKIIVATGRPKSSLPQLNQLREVTDALVMEEGGIVLIKNEEFIRSNEKWQTYINSLPQGLTYASGEVLLITDEHSLEPLTKRASEMGVEFELQPYKSWYFLTPKGVNKLSSVIYTINRMGEDGPTMFVGDELNDLKLIQWADCSIAVGNANEKVKRESDVVLNGNDGEGIKELLRSLLSDSFRC